MVLNIEMSDRCSLRQVARYKVQGQPGNNAESRNDAVVQDDRQNVGYKTPNTRQL